MVARIAGAMRHWFVLQCIAKSVAEATYRVEAFSQYWDSCDPRLAGHWRGAVGRLQL